MPVVVVEGLLLTKVLLNDKAGSMDAFRKWRLLFSPVFACIA
jgi:hypothetical protein